MGLCSLSYSVPFAVLHVAGGGRRMMAATSASDRPGRQARWCKRQRCVSTIGCITEGRLTTGALQVYAVARSRAVQSTLPGAFVLHDLALYKLNGVCIWQTEKIEAIPHDLENCMAIKMHQIGNVQSPLFIEALSGF